MQHDQTPRSRSGWTQAGVRSPGAPQQCTLRSASRAARSTLASLRSATSSRRTITLRCAPQAPLAQIPLTHESPISARQLNMTAFPNGAERPRAALSRPHPLRRDSSLGCQPMSYLLTAVPGHNESAVACGTRQGSFRTLLSSLSSALQIALQICLDAIKAPGRLRPHIINQTAQLCFPP